MKKSLKQISLDTIYTLAAERISSIPTVGGRIQVLMDLRSHRLISKADLSRIGRGHERLSIDEASYSWWIQKPIRKLSKREQVRLIKAVAKVVHKGLNEKTKKS